MRTSLKLAAVLAAVAITGGIGTTKSEAQRWDPYDRCHETVEGVGTGTGVFGRGSARARVAARANWEASVASLYGTRYSRLSNARSIRWDCTRRAVLLAKCVVTARPCGARLRG